MSICYLIPIRHVHPQQQQRKNSSTDHLKGSTFSQRNGACIFDACENVKYSCLYSFPRSLRLSDIIPESKLLSKPTVNSDLTDLTDDSSSDINTCDFFTEECDALHEIFPESSYLELKHCITIANGDIDRATQIILDRQEKGQSITGSISNGHKSQTIDDNELKNRIISR